MTETIEHTTASRIVEDHRRYLFPCAPPYYREPIVLSEGSGVWVRDADGREYLDLFGGILTTGLGHCHPEVVAALTKQATTLGHVSSAYINQPQVDAARSLVEITPSPLDKVFFTNSGTEAVETALLLACQYTGRTEVITVRLAYSGRSLLATNLTAHAPWRPLPSTVAGIKHALAPYPYRCPFCRGPCRGGCADAFADDLQQLIDTTTTGKPAAFMAETVLGVGGFIVPPPGYFQRAAEIIRSYGGLFICDEVQTGFGRTGDHWLGIQHWDVVPDIVVMAKSIASGLPVGATLARSEIADAWTAKTITTFGGNPLSMSAMRATLEVMRREDVPRRSAERGGQLREGLERLAERHSWIGEVRGLGLMQGLELVEDGAERRPSPARAQAFLESAREQGLLVGLGGLAGNVVRLGPSMLIAEDEVSEALKRLESACSQVA